MPAFARIDRARLVARGTPDVTLLATEGVALDRASLDSASVFGEVASTVSALAAAGALPPGAAVERVALTPDFHRGAGMPVGTVLATRGLVLPAAVGGDVGCGMSLAILEGPTPDEVRAAEPALRQALRHAFFEGGRSILATADDREALLARGLAALPDGVMRGLWPGMPDGTVAAAASAAHDCRGGEALPPSGVLAPWSAPGGRRGATRDGELGSCGGGNHFVEVQEVSSVVDGAWAHRWGVRSGALAVMAHSGSLGLGQAVASLHAGRALARYPKGMRRPGHGFLPLPVVGEEAWLGRAYLDDMAGAARFAAANRLALSLMARQAVETAVGRPVRWRLVRDLPHNLAWREGDLVTHRKGACPAPAGEAVVVPGSMGTESALLVGLGCPESMGSAPHGAGRSLSRNAARARIADAGPVPVTPVDPARARADVRREMERRAAEEAPRAYRDLGPVIDTMAAAGMASEVARLRPILTVKA